MKPCSAKTGSGCETNARTSGLKTGSLPWTVAALLADEQTCGRRLPGPRGDGSDQAGRQGKPAGQIPQPLRGQQFVIERHPVEHLIEQPGIAAGDPDREENEGFGIDRPSIGSFDGRRDADLRPLTPGEVEESLADLVSKLRDQHRLTPRTRRASTRTDLYPGDGSCVIDQRAAAASSPGVGPSARRSASWRPPPWSTMAKSLK